MTNFAAERNAKAAALDNARNALALGQARERCIAPAVAKLVPVLVGEHDFYVKGERAAVRPYVARRTS